MAENKWVTGIITLLIVITFTTSGGPPCSWWFHAHLSIRQRSCFPKVWGKSLQTSLKPAPSYVETADLSGVEFELG